MLLDRKIVLLVDDDAEFMAELQEALALSGYIPVPVTNGKEAVSVARRIKPDLILLDLKLGEANGLDVAARIRKIPATSRIPVIMMSGYFSREAGVRALRPSNINLYLTKPFNQRDVVCAIQRILTWRTEEAAEASSKYILSKSI